MSVSETMDAAQGWAVAQTIHQLFQHLDEGRYEELASMFIDGGVWRRQGSDLVGPEAVLTAMRERPDDLATRHLVSNLVITGDGEQADARYYLTVYAHRGDDPPPLPLAAPQFLFTCHDQLRPTDLGWRFVQRLPRLLFARQDRPAQRSNTAKSPD